MLLFSSVFVFSSFSQKLENPKLNRISKELNTLLYTVAVAVVAAAVDVVAVVRLKENREHASFFKFLLCSVIWTFKLFKILMLFNILMLLRLH